jgi:hypothetical protein
MKYRIAGIGSRQAPPPVIRYMVELGAAFARRGFTVVSGNAEGSDQAWARGANGVDPKLVELWLAWRGANRTAIVPGNVVKVFSDLAEDDQQKFLKLAESLHPAWDRVGDAASKLLARNGKIVEGVDVVVGWAQSATRGGTLMAYKMAENFGVPVIDLGDEKIRADLFTKVTSSANLVF